MPTEANRQLAIALAARDRANAVKNIKVPNVRLVIYTKTRTPGTFSVIWNYGNISSGPGLVIGLRANDFEGLFRAHHFSKDGFVSENYDMNIIKSDNFHVVSWSVKGSVQAQGLGMLVEDANSLVVSWTQLNK